MPDSAFHIWPLGEAAQANGPLSREDQVRLGRMIPLTALALDLGVDRFILDEHLPVDTPKFGIPAMGELPPDCLGPYFDRGLAPMPEVARPGESEVFFFLPGPMLRDLGRLSRRLGRTWGVCLWTAWELSKTGQASIPPQLGSEGPLPPAPRVQLPPGIEAPPAPVPPPPYDELPGKAAIVVAVPERVAAEIAAAADHLGRDVSSLLQHVWELARPTLWAIRA